MIEGKVAQPPTDEVLATIARIRMEHPDLQEIMGLPLIVDALKNQIQLDMRLMGLSGEVQMRWYKLEAQLKHWVRLLYTDMTEEGLIKSFGLPDSGRTAEELDANTRLIHEKSK